MATLFLFILSLISFPNFSLAMTTITAMAKDQISCTMCSSCDNPCQPILSPPPPPPPPVPSPPPPTEPNCPPPPSPPPPTEPNSPPPASPPSSDGEGGVYYFSPPPPVQPYYDTPSNNIGYSTPSPPNPIVQYFPFYYHIPPPPSAYSDDSRSVQFKSDAVLPSLVTLLSLLIFF